MFLNAYWRQVTGETMGRILRLFDDAPDPVANSIRRDWLTLSLLANSGRDFAANRDAVRNLLADPAPSVRIVAAEALGRFGNDEDLATALPVLMEYADAKRHGVYIAIEALNALDRLGDKAASLRNEIAGLPQKDPEAPGRTASYCERLIARFVSKFDKQL